MTTLEEPGVLTHEWVPNPKQLQVRSLIEEAPEGSISLIFYGGAAGGAKTNLLANLAQQIATSCPGSRSLVGRQDFTDLKTTTLQEFDKSIPPGLDWKRYDSQPVYRDLRLSPEVDYGRVYFRNLDDWASLLSEEYGWIFIDEGQQVSLQAVLALMSRLRHRPEKKRGIVVGFNPFPSWCVEWGMRRRIPKEILANANIQVHFVRARVEDNPYNPPEYRDLLAANPDPFMRAILLEGNPDIALASVLYFQLAALETGAALCSEPVEVRETRIDPGAYQDGHVLLWEKPLTGERYYIGADTADGKGEPLSIGVGLGSEFGGPDRNAAAIYRARDNVQVAAIYGRQEEHYFARLLDEYGRWFNNAVLGVERNRRSVLVALRELNYPNLYYTEVPVDMHVQQIRPSTQERRREYGWLTDQKSRPPLLSDFREALSMLAVRPRDAALFEECRNFLAGEHPEAGGGFHDDRIFAHAIAWQVRKSVRFGNQTPAPRRWNTTISF